jgi:hypothetical protein
MRPVVVLAMIGKRAMMKETATTPGKPGPIQRMTRGATATIGTVCRKMAYGYRLRATTRDWEKTRATTNPTAKLRMNPARAPSPVRKVAPSRAGR